MRPTSFEIRTLKQSVNDLERQMREKTNICAFHDLMNRVNYLETTNNDLINRVRRLEDDIQTVSNETAALERRLTEMQEHMQRVGGVLEHDRPYEQEGSD